MIYIGGYENEKNQGIYELNDDLSLHCHICKEAGTSYFDVDEQYLYAIIKKDGFGGVAIYDLKGNKLYEYITSYVPACFIEKHGEYIYVANYHASIVQVFDLKLHLLHELRYPKGSKCHCVCFMEDKFGVVTLGLIKFIFMIITITLVLFLIFLKEVGQGMHV